jgi:hypothetical protein
MQEKIVDPTVERGRHQAGSHYIVGVAPDPDIIRVAPDSSMRHKTWIVGVAPDPDGSDEDQTPGKRRSPRFRDLHLL